MGGNQEKHEVRGEPAGLNEGLYRIHGPEDGGDADGLQAALQKLETSSYKIAEAMYRDPTGM